MLIPKTRLCTLKDEEGNVFCANRYSVFDTDTQDFIENKTFTFYDSMYECQEAIDFYNSLSVIEAS